MSVYRFSVWLHLLAVVLWFGHMFFWSLVAGPTLKRVQPPETADTLRRLSMTMGGLGWPALAVLVATGAVQLHYRGINLESLLSGAAFAGQAGLSLGGKLALVAGMVAYQAVLGHKAAPRAIYINMAAAAAIVALSIMFARPGL